MWGITNILVLFGIIYVVETTIEFIKDIKEEEA